MAAALSLAFGICIPAPKCDVGHNVKAYTMASSFGKVNGDMFRLVGVA